MFRAGPLSVNNGRLDIGNQGAVFSTPDCGLNLSGADFMLHLYMLLKPGLLFVIQAEMLPELCPPLLQYDTLQLLLFGTNDAFFLGQIPYLSFVIVNIAGSYLPFLCLRSVAGVGFQIPTTSSIRSMANSMPSAKSSSTI